MKAFTTMLGGTVLAALAFAPAIATACEDEVAAAAAAAPPARIAEQAPIAATKVPSATVKAPVVKAAKQDTAKTARKDTADTKIAAAASN